MHADISSRNLKVTVIIIGWAWSKMGIAFLGRGTVQSAVSEDGIVELSWHELHVGGNAIIFVETASLTLYLSLLNTGSPLQLHFFIYSFKKEPSPRCSVKKVFLEISQISQENMCKSLFFNKVASLRFCEILRTPFFTEHLRWPLLIFEQVNSYFLTERL